MLVGAWISYKDNGALSTIIFGDGEQSQEKAEQWLQTLGTGFEQLQEHFEEPAEDSEAAIAAMVAKALVKAGVREEQDISELEQGFLSACSGSAKLNVDMTEADLSGKDLGASGAIIVAGFLPKCK